VLSSLRQGQLSQCARGLEQVAAQLEHLKRAAARYQSTSSHSASASPSFMLGRAAHSGSAGASADSRGADITHSAIKASTAGGAGARMLPHVVEDCTTIDIANLCTCVSHRSSRLQSYRIHPALRVRRCLLGGSMGRDRRRARCACCSTTSHGSARPPRTCSLQLIIAVCQAKSNVSATCACVIVSDYM